MKNTKQFQAFGVSYKVEEFSAVEGMQILSSDSTLNPKILLAKTFVISKGEVHKLANPEAINEFVKDAAEVLAPRIVLDGIMSIVYEFNFGFVDSWESAKIPKRFLSGSTSITSKNVDPLMSQLMQDGVASLKDLEEYYSLKDAFKMFDSIITKGINAALANEAAMKKTSTK